MKKQIKEYEIKLFNSLANQGEYELTDSGLYRFIFNKIKSNKIHIKGSVLEAGCGSGVIGRRFIKKYPKINITGIDISPKMIERAHLSSSKYTGVCGDLEDYEIFKSNSFDVILCFFVLHHFPSIKKIFISIKKWTKRNGILIIVEPNGENLVSHISRALRLFVEKTLGKEFIIKRKMATPNEINHTYSSYAKQLSKNGFTVLDHGFFYTEPNLELGINIGSVRTLVSRQLHHLFPRSKQFQTHIYVIAKKT